ncbi:MAG: hypothetical protein KIS94_05710 [Chitinophagales bacterium]|nr:hypothetical protein [Chitinophagales bacterium]
MQINFKQTPAKYYRERINNVRNKLPRNYRKILYSHFPELKTAEGKKLIDCTLRGLRTHVQLTKILEAIARGELKMKGTNELELEHAA